MYDLEYTFGQNTFCSLEARVGYRPDIQTAIQKFLKTTFEPCEPQNGCISSENPKSIYKIAILPQY